MFVDDLYNNIASSFVVCYIIQSLNDYRIVSAPAEIPLSHAVGFLMFVPISFFFFSSSSLVGSDFFLRTQWTMMVSTRANYGWVEEIAAHLTICIGLQNGSWVKFVCETVRTRAKCFFKRKKDFGENCIHCCWWIWPLIRTVGDITWHVILIR